jgi:hypothetical protein
MDKLTENALQMAIDALKKYNYGLDNKNTIKVCKAALEQPAQEPVAWVEYMYEEDKDGLLTPYKNLLDYDNGNCIPLYTRPTKRLSDDEKLLIIRKWAENNTMRGQELIGLCDAIEKAHGIGE